jgi:hypothetical protein
MDHDDHWFTRGAHVCQFTDGPSDAKTVLLPFLRDGLVNHEFCLYVTGGTSADEWRYELQAYGVDVAVAQDSGALSILGKQEWRQPDHEFRSLVHARKAYRAVPWTKFNGARVIYDAGWASNPDLAPEDLCHWEATATLLYSGLPVRVICQYDAQTQSAAALDAALRTHPFVLAGDTIVANPYCDAERILEFEPILNYPGASSADVAARIAEVTCIAGCSGFSKKSFLTGQWSRLNT